MVDMQRQHYDHPLQPQQLALDDTIQFNCHPGIACFNACCKNIDILLTPYDLLRLKQALQLSSSDMLDRYTIPFALDQHGLPGLKLKPHLGSTACPFLTAGGCSVYADRPTACRYYALGNMGIRQQAQAFVEEVYFLVKESHCLGHQEPRRLTVKDYLQEQALATYEHFNREWRDLIIKKRSSGPTVGAPSLRSMELFFLASYDIEGFREFIQQPAFIQIFIVDEATQQQLATSDAELLRFAMRFLRQVLYGEMTLPRREAALNQRRQQRAKSRRHLPQLNL